MLRTKGQDIFREDGSKILLKGINLGNWMLIEPNMFGTVGTEIKTWRAIEEMAGKEKAELFFRGLLDKWITEEDISYLKALGFNSVRIPMNYRYFESDLEPFRYLEEGFAQIDRILSYCKRNGLYVILDMHAVQGCQSGDWHCNNIFQEHMDFYYDKTCEERYIALWKQFALRYKDEEWIAGYDLLNEPVPDTAFEKKRLNEIYVHVITEIRKIDKSHLLFVEGSQWAQTFGDLWDEAFGENIVYSPHYYCDGAVQDWAYPGEKDGRMYDMETMRRDMDSRDHWIRKKNRPVWVGEFGSRRLGDPTGKDRSLQDYLTVFQERDASWCYWNFKDLRVRGPLYLDEDSPWCRFVGEFERIKLRYCTDRSLPVSPSWDIGFVFSAYEEGDFIRDQGEVKELLIRNMRETLANELVWSFAKRVAALSGEEIEALTDSFLYKNCKHYGPWEQLFRQFTSAPAHPRRP